MQNPSWSIAIAAGTMLVAPTTFAAAVGLDGALVTITAYCCSAPIPSDAFTVPLTATVGPGIEFPSGSIEVTKGDIITSNVDISSFTIDIQYTQTNTAALGAFNGFGFDFSGSSVPPIIGVSLNPASTFSPGSIGFSFDTDSVFYSGAGLHFTPSSRVVIDIAFAQVPIPPSALLLTTGVLFSTAFVRRQRRDRAFRPT